MSLSLVDLLTCPACAGQQITGHPAGLLTIQHAAGCSVRDAEDATKHADAFRACTFGAIIRDMTPTERLLLTANIATDDTGDDEQTIPEDAYTLVREVAGEAIVNRAWPSLGVGITTQAARRSKVVDLRTPTP